jgi:dipeptidase E
MLILTSDGLSTEDMIKQFQSYVKTHFEEAAIITTASNPFAERHPDIDRHIAIMKQCGLRSVCVDLESQSPDALADYDVIILIGGNPYYLLNVMQKKNCKPLFKALLDQGKVIVGMSAGSMVLGSTIDYVNLLTPEMDVGMDNYAGLALTDMVICPHASSFVATIENAESKLSKYEHDTRRVITKINDGQALFIE